MYYSTKICLCVVYLKKNKDNYVNIYIVLLVVAVV